MIVAETLGEGQEALHRQRRQFTALLPSEAVPLRADRTGSREIDPARALGPVHPHDQLPSKVVEDVQLCADVSERPRGSGKVRRLLREGDRIADRLPAGADLVEYVLAGPRVGGHDRAGRVEDDHVLEHGALEPAGVLVRHEVVADVGRRQVEPDLQPVVPRVVGAVEAGLIPLQPAAQRHAFLVHVIERRPILRGLGSSGERQVVIVGDCRPEHLTLPVRVG